MCLFVFAVPPTDEPGAHYLEWMRKGIHIITPNKKLNSGPLQRYLELKTHQRESFIHYFYEGTVGAGELVVLRLCRGLFRCRLAERAAPARFPRPLSLRGHHAGAGLCSVFVSFG